MRSLLSPAALGAEAERTYNIGDIEDCTLLRSLTNDVYEVSAAGGRYVLKVYGHGWRSAEEVGWEVDLIAHLSRKGLAVEPAVVRADGSYVGTLAAPEGDRPVALFGFAEGAKPSAPSSPLYYEFGRFVGRMHTASADFSSTHPRVAFDVAGSVEDSLQAVLPLLSEREDREFVASLLNRAHERVAELASAGLSWGVCHGDVTLDNLNVTGDGRIVLYDFDSAGPGWQAGDLYGVATWRIHGEPKYWDAFLSGYQETGELTPADLEALPWFVPIHELDNVRWHLTDWLRLRGSHSLDNGYLTAQISALRRWQAEVLTPNAAP